MFWIGCKAVRADGRPGVHRRNGSDGYTLIETLVAMVLFLSVLVPLGFGTAALLIDRKADDIEHALQLGETMMSETLTTRDFTQTDRVADSYFRLRREIDLNGNLLEIRVYVFRVGAVDKPLLFLTKTIDSAQ